MNIQITAKKIEIPQEIRDYIKEKFLKLEKFHQKLSGVEVVIKAEERNIVCEAILRIDGHENVVIEVEGDTIQAAADVAQSKAERQLRKSKERASASVRRRAKQQEDREMP